MFFMPLLQTRMMLLDDTAKNRFLGKDSLNLKGSCGMTKKTACNKDSLHLSAFDEGAVAKKSRTSRKVSGGRF